MMYSWTNASSLEIASLKFPLFLTCSHVNVVKLVHRAVIGVFVGRLRTESLAISCNVEASNNLHAISITSAESFET